ncbi:hypothetical protein [Umezawaea tangerina]|uniref:Uncharacterized protein n=1 Tax=Umezawaea tangerina TaxID=84725 RepID=A0A2T0SLH7_9PSEU|nr:hypothetical protein [Umezawaea tangerina]PRY34255.1 hypothetical protein CLV43_11728 [Umezawaea tangerina]
MINRNPDTASGPLVTRVDIKAGTMLFKNRPVPSADRATVFLDRHGRYDHLTEQIPIGGVSGYRAVFLVNTSVFSRDLQLRLPSREQAYHFIAKVTVRWRVTDPVEAAKTNLVGADPILRPYVERVLRDVGVTFPIEDAAGAEQAMANAFAGRRRQPFAQGVSVLDCDAALTLDSATMIYIRSLEENRRKHDVTTGVQAHTMAEQSKQHRIDLMRSAHELELQEMQQEHELRLKHQQMKFFGGAVAQDPANLLGMILAQDPSKATDVLGMLMKQHQVELDDARGVLDLMLKNELVARGDVAEITGRATSTIAQRMSNAPFKLGVDPTTTPGSPHTTSGPAEGAIAAEVVPAAAKPVLFDFDEDDEDDDD